MIDWGNLAANALWILACALALATFSYASWRASVGGQKLGAWLGKPGIQVSFNVAGVLFCAGLAATSRSTVEIVLWSILGVLFLVQLYFIARRKPAMRSKRSTPGDITS